MLQGKTDPKKFIPELFAVKNTPSYVIWHFESSVFQSADAMLNLVGNYDSAIESTNTSNMLSFFGGLKKLKTYNGTRFCFCLDRSDYASCWPVYRAIHNKDFGPYFNVMVWILKKQKSSDKFYHEMFFKV